MTTKKADAKAAATTENKSDSNTITIRKLDRRQVAVTIDGTTPLITHRFDEKMKRQIAEKQQGGKRTRLRDSRDPEAECEAAAYRLANGSYGFPATTIKNAIISAANKDLGVPKTTIYRALFVLADQPPTTALPPLVKLALGGPPKMREDVVRVGMGSADLRYRPEFFPWSIALRLEYDADFLNPETIFNLIERAGYGVGIGEWRPECSGEFGRFEVSRS